MSLFDDPGALLPGLRPALWRGGQFWIADARHSIGRRVLAQLYPGLDLKTHEDFGGLDGPIRVSGFVIGDDYVAQAERLGRLFRQPGPGTLLHPWRGEITCVLLRPAEFSYASDELRVCRIEAEFDPTTALRTSLLSSLSGLLGAALGLIDGAASLMRGVLSATPMALAVWSLGTSASKTVLTLSGTASAGAKASAGLLPVVAAAEAAMSTALALPTRSGAAAALAEVITGLASQMGAVFKPQPVPAIGAGGTVPEPVVSPDPRDGATLLLSIATTLGAQARSQPADTAVYLSAEIAFAAEAVRLASAISFDSRQDALLWRGRLDAALIAAGGRITRLAATLPAPAAVLWRALGATQAALASDLNEVIGRLPSVTTITPPATVSAFLIAQHLAGNNPAAVVPMVDDIVRRNRLRHPAIVTADPIEVLF